jgi:hypothetical protein
MKSFVLGIHFKRKFTIASKFGEVIDELLYSDNAVYGYNFFTLVNVQNNVANLISQDGTSHINISTSDFILTLGNMRKEDSFEKLLRFTEKISEIFNIVGNVEIIRIGTVSYWDIGLDSKLFEKKFRSQYNASDSDSIFNLSFDKYDFKPKLMNISQDIANYTKDKSREIYAIKKIDEDRLPNSKADLNSAKFNVSIDYQHYYMPFLDGHETNEINYRLNLQIEKHKKINE